MTATVPFCFRSYRKMVKPEEVIVVQTDNGEFVKQTMHDVEAQQLYNTTRECLVFLTHLDADKYWLLFWRVGMAWAPACCVSCARLCMSARACVQVGLRLKGVL